MQAMCHYRGPWPSATHARRLGLYRSIKSVVTAPASPTQSDEVFADAPNNERKRAEHPRIILVRHLKSQSNAAKLGLIRWGWIIPDPDLAACKVNYNYTSESSENSEVCDIMQQKHLVVCSPLRRTWATYWTMAQQCYVFKKKTYNFVVAPALTEFATGLLANRDRSNKPDRNTNNSEEKLEQWIKNECFHEPYTDDLKIKLHSKIELHGDSRTEGAASTDHEPDHCPAELVASLCDWAKNNDSSVVIVGHSNVFKKLLRRTPKFKNGEYAIFEPDALKSILRNITECSACKNRILVSQRV